jgi:HEAT repeat protein
LTTLVSLWELSLLLCLIALLGVAGLLAARLVSERRSSRREDFRKILLPALMRGDAPDVRQSRLARSVAANLTLELAEIVRGSDRETLLQAATSAGAGEELARRLRSRVAQDRLIAAEGLAMFPSYSGDVTRVALADPVPEVRLGAALALAQEGRAPAVGTLIRQLGIGTSENSMLAISLMRDLVKSDPHAVEALLYDLDLPDAVKLAATEALAESGAVDHAPLVAWMAEAAEDDRELRPRIIRALGWLGHPAGHDAILAGLQDNAWQVRAAAVEAAGRAMLRIAVPRLAELLGDHEWWVRFRAGEALCRLGTDGQQALHQVASGADPVAQVAAKATLAERRSA